MSKKLGNMIREARTQKGLTQATLAEQAGISSSEMGKIERGEKEPSQDALKKMAKVLGVTQKSLLEAASGSGASSGKKTSSTGSSASSGKKTSSSGKASSSSKKGSGTETLSATEKKLVQLYRKADSGTKKAAMSLLSGDGNAVEILGSMLLGKKDVSTMASGLLETLLSGKNEKSGPVEEQ
ncbi:MAG: helix-turn-helix transcriptional regulator [Eubacteriales bacterium]|nr:helix-turn-helix transcriptional regulator [Eubacteriales bacterium]